MTRASAAGWSTAGWAAVTVLLVVVLLVAALWLGQRSLIFLPDSSPVPPAAEVLPGARDVGLTTSDGLTLGGWYLPPSDPCDAVVLVAQGNGGNRAGRAGLGRAIHERGFGVLLWDYRGYAGQEGSPSEEGLARDVRAARQFLVDDAGIPPDRLVYLGESLGAAVVSELAVEHPPAALVLRSPFTTLADAGQAAYGLPVGWLLRDEFSVRDAVRRVDAPIAVVLGRGDTIVPPAQSRAVAEAARDAGREVVEVAVDGAGHNDALLAEGSDLVDALVAAGRAGGLTGCG